MCAQCHHDSEPEGNTIDNILYDWHQYIINNQSDGITTGLDPEDSQQTLKQESVTELAIATVVPITIQENFLQNIYDNVSLVSTHFPKILE